MALINKTDVIVFICNIIMCLNLKSNYMYIESDKPTLHSEGHCFYFQLPPPPIKVITMVTRKISLKCSLMPHNPNPSIRGLMSR